MPNAKITKRLVDGLADATTDEFYWDTDVTGFGVRVRASGGSSYVVRYRAGFGRGAPTRRITLGAVGKLTPDEARRIAKTKLAEIAAGADPAAERAKQRAEMTVSELCDTYMTAAEAGEIIGKGGTAKKASTLYSDRGRIERHIKPLIGSRKISAVTKLDIERMMRDVAAGKTAADVKTKKQGRAIVTGGKGAAAKSVNLIGAIFSFAIEHKLTEANPATGVKRYAENRGERFLSSDELERLGAAIRDAETLGIEWTPDPSKQVKHAPRPENRRTIISPYAAAALRLLILTGCRLSEILHLEWAHVDFERGLLFLPTSKTGRKTVVLNAPALAILTGLPRLGRYVIASDSAGAKDEKPRADLSRPWRLVSRAAGLEGVRLHDLRHTHASIGAAAGLGLPIIGKLLGHSQTTTTARYAHLADDPLRRASDVIGSRIAAAMGDTAFEKEAEIVDIGVRRRPAN